MGINRLLSREATIIRRVGTGEKDRHGDETTEPVEVEVRCALQQQRRTEHEDGGETSDTFWLLYLPFGTEIGTGDAVEVDGTTYELVGDPWQAQEGSRSMWHVEASVQRTSGTGEVGS